MISKKICTTFLTAVLTAAAAGADPNTLVSATTLGSGDGLSGDLHWDQNARFAVFSSLASNLVHGQNTGGNRNVFLYDRIAGTLQLVSHLPGNPTTGSSAGVVGELAPQISADGKWVAYTSPASNLAAGQLDSNGANDVFLWSRETDTTVLVSHRSDSGATAGNFASKLPRQAASLSADGRFLAYASSATNLIAGQITNSFQQIYLFDRTTATSLLVSHAANSPVRSADQRSDFPQISTGRSISADGRWVAFLTFATNLADGVTDGNSGADVYLWDREASFGTALRLLSRQAGSPLTAAGGPSDFAVLAADGSAVAFTSKASNVEGVTNDVNGGEDVFRYDRPGDFVELVSHASHSATITGNDEALHLSMSADGQRIAFESGATNHVLLQVDANNGSDIFQWQGSIVLMSHAAGTPRTAGNGASVAPILAADGTAVVYSSLATDLVAGVSDTNGSFDTFLRRRNNNTIILVSHVPDETATADDQSFVTDVALGGAIIGFESPASDLAGGDANGTNDAFFHGSLVMADGFESGDLSAWSQHFP